MFLLRKSTVYAKIMMSLGHHSMYPRSVTMLIQIMEFLKGRIFTDPSLPELSAEERLQLYSESLSQLTVGGKLRQRHWLSFMPYNIKTSV